MHLSSPATATQPILGVPFYTGDFAGLLQRTRKGGLIVVPSAPVLVGLADDSAHRAAVEGADLAITDSGFMVLLWRIYRGQRLPRYSGLKYIRALLQEADFKVPGKSFWVMPTREDTTANLAWLNGQGFALSEADTYLAPHYPRTGPLQDPALLAAIRSRRPAYVMLNLGGGVQERLGYYLREALRHGSSPLNGLPALICTGAAISFLTGRQANIPAWGDHLMLGWLLRCLREPWRFIPRYWAALRLAPLLWHYGECSVAASPSVRKNR